MRDIEVGRGHIWARVLSELAVRRPYLILAVVGIVTVGAFAATGRLQMRMNWADLLPDGDPAVERYREIQTRFGDPSGIVVALEGNRDAIVAMAAEVLPRLEGLASLRVVWGHAPQDYLRHHGAVLQKPNDFDRMLRSSRDWTLVGSLRGINDDFEREYTDSEENLRRDEVNVARSVLGMTRSLELLSAGLAGQVEPGAMTEAADAWVLGERWLLSLDRRMLLISCMPESDWLDLEGQIRAVDEVEAILAEVGERHPDVYASTTGLARVAKDEINSVGTYTLVLSLLALVLIFFLLSRTLRGWVVPVLALAPLVVGIVWTMGLIQLLFGSINLFTSMMALVLLGLGIDFSIHVTARFQEERTRGGPLTVVLTRTLDTTGVAVIIGAFTTAVAFLTLTVGRTVGFDEFGVAAGAGVLLTLAAIFFTLPSLLVIRERRRVRKGHPQAGMVDDGHGIHFPTRAASGSDEDGRRGLARTGYAWIGHVAAAAWRHPLPVLGGTALIIVGGVYGMLDIEWEWDFLELEAAGLRSVELQREIPERFGTSDHAAWSVASSIEESRRLKEAFREIPTVGEVAALSDLVPPPERVERYRPRLETFRADVLNGDRDPWPAAAGADLAAEIDRLWDNLDLMSNLAFTAGLDRIVTVIDRVTGLETSTGETDPDALLPTLTRQAGAEDCLRRVGPLAAAWAGRMKANLEAVTNPEPVTMADVPANQRRLYLPREGDGMLVNIFPRGYLGDRAALERFAAQTEEVDPAVVGTEQLILLMNEETLNDGESAALLALIVTAGLLLVYFRSPAGLLALIPLAVGAVAMLGLMYVLGIRYNYMNMIAVPIILGIGIDDGVHALHRFREEDDGSAGGVYRSFRHVGKAILLTSVTTMIGFGSVMVYEMRGMASFGQVLFIGVGACFLATILVLPAVLRLARRSRNPERSRTKGAGTVVTSLLLGTAVLGSIVPASAQTPDSGATWLARIEAAEKVPHSYSVLTQTITTSGGSERTFTVRSWSAQDGDVALMAYVEPRRVAGDRILQIDGGDQFWYYMDRRDVTRHFAGHTRRQKAMGSDFSYEDLSWGDFTEDYTAELLGREPLEGEATVKLRLTPTPSGPSYHHLILWAGEDDHLTRQIEYWDEEHHLKTLYLSDFREVEDRTVAMRMEMVNHREGSRTVMETLEITFAEAPDASLFTRAALTRPLPQGGGREE